MRTSEEYNLKVLYPQLAKEWHPTKNGILTPETVAPHTARKVWWKCENGHEWQASINSRSRGCGCPYCYGRYPTEDYNLKVIKPELAAQWHPTKNGDWTPDQVTPSSRKTAWWICEKGHEWETTICDRSRHGCPICGLEASRKKRGTTNLKETNPELCEEWHPTKNGDLTPDKVSPGSKIKVWWICEEGHSWEAAVKKRVKGTGCPYCSGRRASEDNNLQEVNPKIAAQWHPIKNGSLTPRDVTPGSKTKVWWLCEKGHVWETTILNRKNGNGCPYCSGKLPSRDYNLATVHPDIAAQWHPTKNGRLTPQKVTPSSSTEVFWKCEKGHEWYTRVSNRVKGKFKRGCPVCAGKKVSWPYKN